MLPTVTSKDNVLIWGAIFMPRLLCGLVIISLCYLGPTTSGIRGVLLFISVTSFVVNLLNTALCASPRLNTFAFGKESKPENTRIVLMGLSIVLISSMILLTTLGYLHNPPLSLTVILGSFLTEILHIHLIPVHWKHEPHTQDNIWQDFYVLFLFLFDFIFICLLSHLVAKGCMPIILA